MPEQNPSTIQLPSSPTQPKEESVVIFTMPESYRHGAAVQAHIPEPAKKVSVPVVLPTVPKPQAVLPKKSSTSLSSKKKSLVNPWVLLAGGIFILALAIAGGILYLNRPVATQVVTKPQVEQVLSPVDTTTDLEERYPPAEEDLSPADVFETEAVPGQDADSDGLTNVEERLIYGTDVSLPDTDRDGFLDGNEVFHGYAPNSLSPSTLRETAIVEVFDWQEGGLHILVPKGWIVKEEESLIRLSATTGEMFVFQKISETFDARLTVKAEDQYEMTTKQGHRAIMTEDQQTAVFEVGSQAYELIYDVGIKGTLDYVQTFYMMLNTLYSL